MRAFGGQAGVKVILLKVELVPPHLTAQAEAIGHREIACLTGLPEPADGGKGEPQAPRPPGSRAHNARRHSAIAAALSSPPAPLWGLRSISTMGSAASVNTSISRKLST